MFRAFTVEKLRKSGRRMQRSGLEISDKKTREELSKSPPSAKASRRIT